MKWNIGWGITSQCNMKCAFCYSRFKRMDSKDLRLKEWVSFIDDNYSYINSINYGTGENTLCGDWFLFVNYVREKYPGIRQSLTTNGYLSVAVEKSKNLEIFKKAIDEVDISLDFAQSDQHNTFRGQTKAYDWALDTLKLCSQYKKQTTLVFLGSNKTLFYDNIDGLFGIARKYNAVLRMNIFRPTEGLNQKSAAFIVSRDVLLDCIFYINEHYSILSLGDSYLSAFLLNQPYLDPSGNKSLRILSNGNITPSTYLINDNYLLGNIQEKNILQNLSTRSKLSNVIKDIIPKECAGCVYRNMCKGGIYDRRYLWYGSLEKKEPYCNGPYLVKNERLVQCSKTQFSSVHSGYLPTIFFSPYKNEDK